MPESHPRQPFPAALLEAQRAFFASGATLAPKARVEHLRRLRDEVRRRRSDMAEAMREDLGRHRFETLLDETLIIMGELDEAIKRTPSWSAPRRVRPSLLSFPSRDSVRPEPFGCTLIISPWNYPFLLAFAPLISALAAGNCAIVKPSELAPASSRLIADIVRSALPQELAAVAEGDADTARALLALRFDKIFFTGSTRVGRAVMEAAARHLTPVTLELGGKSPCFVTETADIRLAARRIAWGKLTNCGQTCIAPDYVLAHPSIKDALLEELDRCFTQMYGPDAEAVRRSPDYGRIVSPAHVRRLSALLPGGDGTGEGTPAAPLASPSSAALEGGADSGSLNSGEALPPASPAPEGRAGVPAEADAPPAMPSPSPVSPAFSPAPEGRAGAPAEVDAPPAMRRSDDANAAPGLGLEAPDTAPASPPPYSSPWSQPPASPASAVPASPVPPSSAPPSRARIVRGGEHDAEARFFAPTLLDGISYEDAVMQEEIFGPILPVLEYRSLEEEVQRLAGMERPLALYLFTGRRADRDLLWSRCHFGGGCVNDTLLHFANRRLPFGGVGASGMGRCHGRWGFEEFSHLKSLLERGTLPDVPLRWPPHESRLKALLLKFLG